MCAGANKPAEEAALYWLTPYMEDLNMGASNTWIRTSLSQGGTAAGKRRVRRVLIVDDHPIVRQGLRRVMENEDDLTVCGEAESARDARTAIKELNPDVVVADISLKQGDGIELVRDVRAHHPQLPILVLSMHDETIYAERMFRRRQWLHHEAGGQRAVSGGDTARVSTAASTFPNPSATT
jgi:CheY-like chemotaxis protein